MIINISTNLSFTMSIDNGHYKQFGGIDDLYMIKDFQTGDIYTNTVSAKTYRVNDLAWDVSSGGNRITNVLDGNIIIGGEISGNLAPGAGENIVFKSDKQYWNAFTDLNNIGRIINRNTSATDISGITLSEPATAYLYDGMVEISGVLISGHLHINSDNSRNLVFIQGISNEIQGTEPSRYQHVEGENNVVVAGNTQYSHVEGYGNTISGDFIQCEGSGNVVYGDFSHAEGEKNRIDISGTGNFCFVEGYDCSVSGVSEFSKAEGYKSSVVNSNYSLAYGREGTVKNSYGSVVGSFQSTISGGNYSYVEGSGNTIGDLLDISGAFVAGMGNRSQSSYSTVLGEYNEASNNVIFSIGHGTGDADSQRKDALVIRTDNTQTGAGRGEGFRDISVNVGMSATDISVGWWVADTVHQNPCFTVSISDDAIWIDGSKSGTVELDRYKTYKFLQDGSSNIGEPFIIVATQDNSSTVLVPHQGFTTTGTAGVDRECLLNVNDLNITNSTLYYMSNNNTITGGEIKIKDNIYENGKISVAKTTDTGTLTTNVYSNGKQVDTEVNSIIHTTDISCSEDVSAVSHYTNGVLDYNSGFLFGSSERLTNADKWKTSNKVQHLGSSKSQIFSATFDGTNFMDISSTLISDLDSSSHSFAVWVKLTNTDLYSKILGSFGDTSGGFFLYHRGTNNNFGYQVSNSNYTYAVSQTVALNTWYHIVGTYNSTSGAIKLYLNGVNNSLIYNAGTGYSPAVNKYRFSFGTSSETSTWSPIWQRLHGNLYDFRYFNRVMTDAEITALYNNPAIVGDEVLRLPLSDPSIILDGISGSYSSFTIDDIDGSANVLSTEILFSDSASDLDLYNRLVPVGITEYDISYVYNIDASLVDISGAGFQMRAKKTMLIETNQHELVVSDASVCDVINVLPIDNGGGIDLYLPVPYYGIGTKYSVQFPPAGTLVSPDTSFNYNRVIFDMNGGGFSTADAIVSKDIGFAVHFVYTSETDGLIWKSRLRAYDATD